MNTEEKRRERLVATIRTIWESLDSHLDYSISHVKKRLPEGTGNRKFHADTVRDYAKAINDLAQDL